MEEYLDSYILSNGSKSKATRQTEMFNIKRIGKVFDKDPFTLTVADFQGESLDLFMSRLGGIYELKTILTTLFSARNLMDYMGANAKDREELMVYLKEVKMTNQEQAHKQEPNALRKQNQISYKDLRDKLVERIGDPNLLPARDLEPLMALSLYVLIPPRRLGDYGGMVYKDATKLKRKLEHFPKDKNYIVYIGDGKYKVVVNNYKNARRGTEEQMGQYSNEIKCDLLNGLIHNYFNRVNASKKFLFTKAKGESIDAHTFGLRLKRYSKKYLDKELTCDSFRHIFLTDYHENHASDSILEKKEALKHVGQNYVPPVNELYVDKL
jgi:integrase